MRSAARWAANRHESHARCRVTRSSFWLISTRSTAPHAHHTLTADDTHRANELTKLQLAAKLVQPPFAGTRAECWNPEVNPRCVAAGRRSAPDISSTSSVRRDNLR